MSDNNSNLSGFPLVQTLIRLEGLVVFVLAVYGYYLASGNWWLFLLLLLTPDLSMVGYLKNNQWGAIFYNMVHNYLLAILLVAIGTYGNNNFIAWYGLILAAHIGLDHLLGFGLKYPDNFKSTHIQRL